MTLVVAIAAMTISAAARRGDENGRRCWQGLPSKKRLRFSGASAFLRNLSQGGLLLPWRVHQDLEHRGDRLANQVLEWLEGLLGKAVVEFTNLGSVSV